MDADGSGVTRLIDDDAYDDLSPDWSPDGQRIAFYRRDALESGGDGDADIYVMNADGSEVTRLTDNNAADYFPAWSPDGRRIAFSSDRDGDYRDGNRDIYVMNADGSGVTRLTDDDARDDDPAWSPDGQRIAFRYDREGNADIYVMNADGSEVTRLTDNDASDMNVRNSDSDPMLWKGQPTMRYGMTGDPTSTFELDVEISAPEETSNRYSSPNRGLGGGL